MIGTIDLGSIEYIAVEFKDQIEGITTLVGTNPRYDIIEEETGTKVHNNLAAVVDGTNPMRVLCLATTTGWTPGEYDLHAWFTSGAQTPKAGPFRFKVR